MVWTKLSYEPGGAAGFDSLIFAAAPIAINQVGVAARRSCKVFRTQLAVGTFGVVTQAQVALLTDASGNHHAFLEYAEQSVLGTPGAGTHAWLVAAGA